jgi:hypothetical protein
MTKHDPSTTAILSRLKPQKSGARPVTTSHAGVDSVHAGRKHFLKKARAHTTPVKPGNAVTNALLNQVASPVPRKQPTPGEMVAAGLTNATPVGTPFSDS